MSPSRRDFLKGLGATAALSLYAHDLVAETIAMSPKGRVAESKFKGMADIVLKEAKLGGCSYADVRFTMTANVPGGMAFFRTDATVFAKCEAPLSKWSSLSTEVITACFNFNSLTAIPTRSGS